MSFHYMIASENFIQHFYIHNKKRFRVCHTEKERKRDNLECGASEREHMSHYASHSCVETCCAHADCNA